jgi:hypothetical protein
VETHLPLLGRILATHTEVESGKHDDRPELKVMDHAKLTGSSCSSSTGFPGMLTSSSVFKRPVSPSPLATCPMPITPRRTGASQPQHGIDKQAIVLTMSSFVAFRARNKPFNAPPLRVRKFSPNQDHPPQLRS